MSNDLKEFKEDGMVYQQSSKSVNTRSRKSVTTYTGPFLQELDINNESVTDKNLMFSQTRNQNTGHWIKRNEFTGELTSGNGTRPFVGIPVRRKFKAVPNPSITPDTAEMAEKAVLAILNRALKK
ncbi:hypothetical protein [Dyadobacter sp. CY356]|uniref:hypothetical protein n=1 Tax=Dyadobacter sp. CY356 TaxID=2906442 RepID=UPI001F16F8B3|nr:hypothetical protein [Dyadobacter sp. CY356]MCF0055857.1 hypothetical protein [Dyadobacter sp. CY356]